MSDAMNGLIDRLAAESDPQVIGALIVKAMATQEAALAETRRTVGQKHDEANRYLHEMIDLRARIARLADVADRLESEATEAMAFGGADDNTDTMNWAAAEIRAAAMPDTRLNDTVISGLHDPAALAAKSREKS